MRRNRMKRVLAIVAALAVVGVLIALCQNVAVLAAALWGMHSGNHVDIQGVATADNPVISPSGEYEMRVVEETLDGVRCNRFAIFRVSNGSIEPSATFTAKDAYRTRDRLYFVWDDNDRVWVYSGDVGTYFWERVSDDNWEKHAWADNGSVPVPALLRKLESGYYDGS